MVAGNVTLLEAAKHGNDMVKAGVIETIIQESPLIEMIPWKPFAGTALKHYEEGTLPSVQFRNVNEGYTSTWGTDNAHFWGVAILGGEITVDRFLEDVVGNADSIEQKQWMKLAKANAMRFDYEALKGTGSAASKGFKGVNELISEGFGQTQSNGTATISLPLLDEAFDKFRNQGQPDLMLANRTVRRQLTAAGRNTAGGFALIDVGTDTYGRQVVSYNGTPIRITGDVIDASGNVVPLLDFDEASSSCSAYLMKLGEDDVCGLLGKGGSFQVQSFGELESGPQRMGRLEWYPGLAIFNQYSIVRITGITAS